MRWPMTEFGTPVVPNDQMKRRIAINPGGSPHSSATARTELALGLWRSRIDNGLRGLVTAEDDEKIADHRGFAFLVELHRAVLFKTVQGHFDHSHGSDLVSDPK